MQGKKPYKHSPTLIQSLRQLSSHLSRRRRRQLIVLLLLMLLSSLSEMISLGAIFPFLKALTNANTLLTIPWLQPMLQLFRIETPVQIVAVLALGFILAVSLANGLRLLTLHIRIHLGAAVGIDVSSKIYHIILRQPYNFHIQHNSSDLIQTVTEDVTLLTNNILMPLLALVNNALLIPSLIIMLLLIDTKITLGIAVVLGMTYALIYRIRQNLLKQNSKIIAQFGQRKIKIVQESIGGIRDVLLGDFQVFFERVCLQSEQDSKQAAAANAIISRSPMYLIETLMLSVIALLALSLGQNGDFSRAVPILGSMALGAKRLLPALQEGFGSLAIIQGSRTALTRVLVALQRPINPFLSSSIVKPLRLENELRFDKVWFRYGEGADWVLKDFTLSIPARNILGIVGSTGSGKSTVADLILGLLSPSKGMIWVDEFPLEGEELCRWRQSIAHVPQHIFLSDDTIAENIAFGIDREQIDFEQVRRSAKLSRIDTFIENLPAKYDTYIGERGIRLSGGQRQRIAIARALYRNASVIVFDEATSALDNVTEREVMAAINSLSSELTIILIAHRLSTLEQCNQIVELFHGAIRAKGTYQELLKHSETFRKMSKP